ncbi:MAG TPA: hypothetical protein VIK91_07120 [Nannocystis sp.]
MIEPAPSARDTVRASPRRSALLLAAAILLAVGCKDTSTAVSGPPVTQEPGGSAFVSAPVDAPLPEETQAPASTATAGDTAPRAESGAPDSTEVFVECTGERPTMCTREYRPVCGKLQSGEWRTYGNKCTACADPDVLGFRAGACEEHSPPT